MKFSNSLPRSGRQAFTLVEVLISSALTIIVLMMLFAVLLGSMNAWEGGTSRLQTNADARLALDLIASDLQSMVVRQTPYNQQWLSSRPVTVTGAPSGVNSTWLTFFAPSIDRDSGQEGDIVAISYVAGFQDPFTKTDFVPMYGLYKTMIDTTNTFAHALGKTDIFGGFWGSNLVIDRKGSPVAVNSLPLERLGFMIPNVIDFKVAWWIRSNANPTLLTRIEADKVLSLSNQLAIDSNPVDAKIVAADVSLTILTDAGMREARLGDTSDYNRLKDIIRKHGRVHSQRVVIQY